MMNLFKSLPFLYLVHCNFIAIYDIKIDDINTCMILSSFFMSSGFYCHNFEKYTGLILDLHWANERRHYKVTPSLNGWAQT